MNGVKKSRFIILYIVLGIIAVMIVSRLFEIQLINGESYSEASESRLITSMSVKAPRGEIYDRYGRPMVKNRIGFSLMFQQEFKKNEDLNRMILKVINVFRATNDTYEDSLPVSLHEEFVYTFTGENEQEVQEKKEKFLDSLDLSRNATPGQVISSLCEEYGVPDEYSPVEKRAVVGIRYEMKNHDFGAGMPYTFATDVSMNVVSVIKENADEYGGVYISIEPFREYVYDGIGSHFLGHIGLISREEYDRRIAAGEVCKLNDLVGKSGVEKYLDKYLKGTDGISATSQDVDGKKVNLVKSRNPVTENYAVLTIDAELQNVLETSLAETIQQLSTTEEAADANAGAAVVIDVNSGEVLAMASYPTYSINDFYDNYQSMIEDPLKPMWNRAISGTYEPGSTFKMITSIAALNEGVITPDEFIFDRGVYKYYEDYQPQCWIYSERGVTHGIQNASLALMNSCNYYFYEVAQELGIDKIAEYAEKFGLGSVTGIELAGEAAGLVASPEKRKSNGGIWYPGDTLQAAIGQSDNLLTPIQIANYIAALANGGTLYQTHIVKGVQKYSDNSNVFESDITVKNKIEMSEESLSAVKQGMLMASREGTASAVFEDYGIDIASKTGTASVPSGTANGIFAAFAPYDNPQIAIAVVVDHGAHGNNLGQIARNVTDYYFNAQIVDDEIQQKNTLVR